MSLSPKAFSIMDSDKSLEPYITSFIIDADSRYCCGTDHALLKVNITFKGEVPKLHKEISDVLNFRLPLNHDYSNFHQFFKSSDNLPSIDDFKALNVDEMANVLTSTLFSACCKSLLSNYKSKSFKRRHWLPQNIVKHIKIRRLFQSRLVKEQRMHGNDSNYDEYIAKIQKLLKIQRNRVRTMLSEFRSKQTNRVRNRLQRENMTTEGFWKFLRQHSKATSNITASYTEEGSVVFDHKNVSGEVVKKWSSVFSGQTEPAFNDANLPELPVLDPSSPILKGLPQNSPTKHEAFLCRPFTPQSLKDTLVKLKDNKSCGVDNIPSEILKYSDDYLQKYLLVFYNRIWEKGIVPEQLNTIKCILLHKSGDSLDMLNYR